MTARVSPERSGGVSEALAERRGWGRRRAGIERVGELGVATMLVVFVLAAPHSIAVTQGAFIAGMAFWIIRGLAAGALGVTRTPIDLPLAVFVGWTVAATALSEAPAHSLGRMRGVSLFLILYLFASNVRSKRFAWVLTLLLTFSSIANLGASYVERARGEGLEIESMTLDSPLRKYTLQPGDTVLAIDGQPVTSLEELNRHFGDANGQRRVRLTFMRQEGIFEFSVRKKPVRQSGEGVERLGVTVAPGREFRATGFFSHPVTYSEVMLLVGAVAAAWSIAAGRRRWRWAVGMGALALAIAGVLVMTATRASIVAFAVAVVAMVLLRGVGKRAVAAAMLAGILLVAAAGAFIAYGRGVGYVDLNDQSTTWRLTVWREGIGLVAKNPVFGVGPDAAKVKHAEWGLFDNGRLPPGHWHSTPLQIAVDRGIPALAAFFALFGIFFVVVARLVRSLAALEASTGDWRVTAAVLGAWGGVLGSIVSSFVHFNIGDSEVVQVLWALMGIALAVRALHERGTEARQTNDELQAAR